MPISVWMAIIAAGNVIVDAIDVMIMTIIKGDD